MLSSYLDSLASPASTYPEVEGTASATPPDALSSAKAQLLAALRAQEDGILACPVSLEPLTRSAAFFGGSSPVRYTCSKFGTSYGQVGPYVDLVPRTESAWGGGKGGWGSMQEIVQTQLFRSPVTAFLYERGWRQGFANAGFPGVDREFEEVERFFGEERLGPGAVVLDMSCGSGLMSRKLAGRGTLGRLVSADYSEVMLRETARRFASAGSPPPPPPFSTPATRRRPAAPRPAAPLLVRCDVAALPFRSGALDAVHAGAALHCWPRLDEGLAEVCRVLKPGGRFFATTFKKGAYGVPRQVNDQGSASFRFFDEGELEGLLAAAGFSAVGVELVGSGCLVARCSK